MSSEYSAIARRESVANEEGPSKRLQMVDEELHGAHMDYAEDDALEDGGVSHVVLAKMPVVDAEREDLNAAIMGEYANQHDKEETKTAHLSKHKVMANMEVKIAAERKPTNVGTRRAYVLFVLGAFAAVLFVIVLAEASFNGFADGIRAIPAAASNGRKDVFLVRFSAKNQLISWNATEVVQSDEFASAVAVALENVPFNDFSVEMRITSLDQPVEIACIQHEGPRVRVAETKCSVDLRKVLALSVVVTSPSQESCSATDVSALKNAIKCRTRAKKSGHQMSQSHQADKSQLGEFWKRVFKESIQEGKGLSSSCCDVDQVFYDLSNSGLLEMCSAPLDKIKSGAVSSKRSLFFNFYGREESSSCRRSICDCECIADRDFRQGSLFDSSAGCPSIEMPEGAKDVCQQMDDIKGESGCVNLPNMEQKHKSFFGLHKINLGKNSRCYGSES